MDFKEYTGSLTPKEQEARKMVCLPLDNLRSMDAFRSRVDELSPVVGLFKVGKGSYTRFGPQTIDVIHDSGAGVFLDLKYHDIPATVRDASRAAAERGVRMCNVHASGGYEMMLAAREGADDYSGRTPKIIGVTVLTSLDNLRYMQNAIPLLKSLPIAESHEAAVSKLVVFPYDAAIEAHMRVASEKDAGEKVRLQRVYLDRFGEPFDALLRSVGLENLVPDTVLNFAQMTQRAGLDGVVCSAADLSHIKERLPDDFMFVTPGIKGPRTPAGADQKRVFSPGNAYDDGSSIQVIGRTITGHETSEERLQAGYDVLQHIAARM